VYKSVSVFSPFKALLFKTSSIRSVTSQLMFFEMWVEGRNFSTVDAADTGKVAWGKVTLTHTRIHTELSF